MSSRLRQIQTTFERGQIDSTAIQRSDIELFAQALAMGMNWRLISSGGLTRRPGTVFFADMGQEYRLVPFEFDEDQLYIFAMTAGNIRVFQTDGTELVTLVVTEITYLNLWELTWEQSGDFIFLCHHEMVMKEIQRTSLTTFNVSDYTYDKNDDGVWLMPFFKFAEGDVTIAVAGVGPYTLTTSSNYWVGTHVSSSLQIRIKDDNGDWFTYVPSGYVSPTVINALRLEVAAPTLAAPVKTWTEQAISSLRGYPQAIAFHAGRLWLGGFKSLPAHLAASKIGLFWNFDVGTAADDDAIFAPIDSDRINSIRHIVSGNHLQIFTDLSELHISEEEGRPITPSTVSVRTNTRFGSNFVRPQVFDDASLYVQRQGAVIREYLWNGLDRKYTSNPLTLLANEQSGTLKQAAIDYGGEDGAEQYAYFLNTAGDLAVFHSLRSEQVSGFLPWTTGGDIKSICVCGNDLYAIVERVIDGSTVFWLERFDKTEYMDSVVSVTAGSPQAIHGGFTIFANETVHVTSENNSYYLGTFVVDGAGQIDLTAAGYTATQLSAGLNYTATIESLPLNFAIATGRTEQLPKRLVSAAIRIHSSCDFKLSGTKFVSRNINDDISLPPRLITGIRRGFFAGAAFDRTVGVISDIPLSCTVLSISTEVGL